MTFNGSVWSEVTNYDQMVPRADASVKLGTFANDPSLTQALRWRAGQVVVSDITFQLNPNVPILDRLVPFLRLSAPVVPDSSFDMNVAGRRSRLTCRPGRSSISCARRRIPKAADQEGRRVIVADHAGQILYDTANPKFRLRCARWR